jgi:hypothetical protein
MKEPYAITIMRSHGIQVTGDDETLERIAAFVWYTAFTFTMVGLSLSVTIAGMYQLLTQ